MKKIFILLLFVTILLSVGCTNTNGTITTSPGITDTESSYNQELRQHWEEILGPKWPPETHKFRFSSGNPTPGDDLWGPIKTDPKSGEKYAGFSTTLKTALKVKAGMTLYEVLSLIHGKTTDFLPEINNRYDNFNWYLNEIRLGFLGVDFEGTMSEKKVKTAFISSIGIFKVCITSDTSPIDPSSVQEINEGMKLKDVYDLIGYNNEMSSKSTTGSFIIYWNMSNGKTLEMVTDGMTVQSFEVK